MSKYETGLYAMKEEVLVDGKPITIEEVVELLNNCEKSRPVGSALIRLLADAKIEISEGFDLARGQLASERLAGNIVKEEYWKGELAAYARVNMILSADS